jgi:hemerythrin-like domain-containing protein
LQPCGESCELERFNWENRNGRDSRQDEGWRNPRIRHNRRARLARGRPPWEKLFDAFEKAGSDLEAKAALAQRACEELSVHAMLEEELLYPAAADALPDSDLVDVDEAYVEHYLVKTLIKRFEVLKAGDKGFDATFKVMSELVKHHVDEEEDELFPELRRSKCDLAGLGRKIAARKEVLEGKLEAVGSNLVGDKT